MLVLCAWCQQEGKQAVLRGVDEGDEKVSHGICQQHRDEFIEEAVKMQARRSNPRRRKYRRRR